VPPKDCQIVWYLGLNCTWNCCKTRPVIMFSTRATDRAWNMDLPRYTPTQLRLSHLQIDFPCCSAFCNAYTGQPNGLDLCGSALICPQENTLIGHFPHRNLRGPSLNALLLTQMAEGHRLDVTAVSHLCCTCISKTLALSCSSLIRLSVMPDWKCMFTPE
jgi:hypothetical protein